MKKLILALILATSFLAAIAEAATLRKGPYLIYPDTNTQMAVLWQADVTPGTSHIEWGTNTSYGNSSGLLTESGSGLDEHQFAHVITGLTPGTRYYYNVTVDSQQVAGSFMAAPENSATSISFYAYGDTRTYPASHDSVLASVLYDLDVDLNPDQTQTFMLHAGDWISSDIESEWQTEYFNRAYANTLEFMSKIPIMGARGNHEGDASELRKYWPYAGNNSYYSFDYGPVHVTVIDQYVDFSPGSVQYQWIVSDLADSTKPFKFAIYHEPAWNADAYAPSSRAINAQEYLQPLFVQYGVRVVVGGHNHNYARAVVDGVHHITTGGGGVSLNTPVSGKPYVVTYDKSHHFCQFDVTGNTLKVTAIRSDDSVIETFDVAGPGLEPTALDDGFSTLTDTELNVAVPGVLANDFDPQGDSLTAVLDADVSNGTLLLNGNGSFDYTPGSGFTGDDTFTYHVNDGVNDSLAATVTINVTDWLELYFDDFESGWGNYTSAGVNAYLDTYAHSGTSAATIVSNTATSLFTLTNPVDVTGYTQLQIDYWVKTGSMESGEDYFVEFFDGTDWQVAGHYVSGVDFAVGTTSYAFNSIVIDSTQFTFPVNMQIRFRNDASATNDYVDIDDILIRARSSAAPPINPPPVASFTYECVALDCTFDGSDSTDDGAITGYDWIFGDGNTSGGVNPVNSYSAAGAYTVTLTVTDDDGDTGSTDQPVTVTEPAPHPPAAPSNLTLTVEKSGKGNEKYISAVTLNWADNSDIETGFIVEGCQQIVTGKGNTRAVICDFVEVGINSDGVSAGENETSFSVDLSIGHDHFRVKAVNEVGSSAWSNEVKF